MKRLLLSLLLLLAMGTSTAWALDYETARREAWFLTDKMAYELNLTPEQYDRAYQVNLDYLMSIDRADDCYGNYWTYRDADLRCIFFDWQYTLYTTLDYFYRPIRRLHSVWYFPIADRYRAGYYYFDRPGVYLSYRGSFWRRRGHNDISPYVSFVPRPGGGLRDYYRAGARPGFRPEYGRPGGGRNDRYGRPQNGYSRPGYGNSGYGRPDYNRPGRNDYGRSGNAGADRPNRGDNGTSRPGNTYTRPGNGSRGGGRTDRGAGVNRPSQNYGVGSSRPSRSGGVTGSGMGSRTFGRH